MASAPSSSLDIIDDPYHNPVPKSNRPSKYRKRGDKKQPMRGTPEEEEIADSVALCYHAIRSYEEPETGRLLCEPFMELPDKSQYPSYYQVIKKPICMK